MRDMDYPVERCSVSFDIPLRFFTDVVEDDVRDRAVEIAKDAAYSLISMAPVDTSRYVSNMNVTHSAPNFEHDDFKFIGTAGSRGQATAAFEAMPKVGLYNIYIVNTVDYAGELETPEGASSKAPYGIFNPVWDSIVHHWT